MKKIASNKNYRISKIAMPRPSDPGDQIIWDILAKEFGNEIINNTENKDSMIVDIVTDFILRKSSGELERDRVRAWAQEFIFPYFGEPFIAQKRN